MPYMKPATNPDSPWPNEALQYCENTIFGRQCIVKPIRDARLSERNGYPCIFYLYSKYGDLRTALIERGHAISNREGEVGQE